MKPDHITCKLCGDAVPLRSNAMYIHAITKHWSQVLLKYGPDGLVSLGYAFGKQLQNDNPALKVIAEGLTDDGKN